MCVCVCVCFRVCGVCVFSCAWGVCACVRAWSKAWADMSFEDLYDGSCLNGWTMGNLAAAPSAMAGSLYNVFGKHPVAPILSNESLAQMMDFHPVRAWVHAWVRAWVGGCKARERSNNSPPSLAVSRPRCFSLSV